MTGFDITCESCRGVFHASKSSRRYCSPECFQQTRLRKLETRECPVCHKGFAAWPSKIARFCSLKCARAGRTPEQNQTMTNGIRAFVKSRNERHQSRRRPKPTPEQLREIHTQWFLDMRAAERMGK